MLVPKYSLKTSYLSNIDNAVKAKRTPHCVSPKSLISVSPSKFHILMLKSFFDALSLSIIYGAQLIPNLFILQNSCTSKTSLVHNQAGSIFLFGCF